MAAAAAEMRSSGRSAGPVTHQPTAADTGAIASTDSASTTPSSRAVSSSSRSGKTSK